jgi:class 3 adenylate cyclase
MYFEMIVKEVMRFGGDILKFAGDAIFVEWPMSVMRTGDKGTGRILAECVTIASLCGSSIVRACSDFPIYAPAKGDAGKAGVVSKIGTLNVHCGVGVGDVAGVHVGDDEYRREFLLVGEPIDQVYHFQNNPRASNVISSAAHTTDLTLYSFCCLYCLQVAEAEGAAALGELAASPRALNELQTICDLEECLLAALKENKCGTIASKNRQYFTVKASHSNILDIDSPLEGSDIRDLIVSRCDMYDTAALERFLQKIGLYVHSVVVDEEKSQDTQHHRRNSLTAQERHRAEAELRNVYTMFIMPLITAKLSGESRKDQELFHVLNNILMVVNRELTRYSGHLRQFIVDDKGLWLVIPSVFCIRNVQCFNHVLFYIATISQVLFLLPISVCGDLPFQICE